MSITVLTNGYDAIKSASKKSSLVLPDGRHCVVFASSSTNIRVYVSTTRAAGSYTQLASLTVSTMSDNPRIVAELGHDGLYIDIVYRRDGYNIISHRRLTIATAVATAEANVLSLSTSYTIHTIDLSTSPTGALLVGMDYANTAPDRAGYMVYLRTTGGAWSQIRKTTIDTASSFKSNVYESSIAWHNRVDSNVRRFTFITSSVSAAGVDRKLIHLHGSVDETTGTGGSFVVMTAPSTDAIGTTGAYTQQPRRTFLFTMGNNSDVLGATVQSVGTKMEMYVHHFVLTTVGANAAADVVTRTDLKIGTMDISSAYLGAMAATFALDNDSVRTLNFWGPATGFPDNKPHIYMQVWKADSASSGRLLPGWSYGYPNNPPEAIFGGSGRVFDKRHEVLYFWDLNNRYAGAGAGRILGTAFDTTPAASELIATSKPLVGVSMNNVNWGKVAPVLFPVIEVATDAAFTTGLQSFAASEGGPMMPYSPSGVSFTKYSAVWGGTPLAPGSYYIRAALRDVYGNQTNWSAIASPIQVSHPGYARNLNPPIGGAGDSVIPWSDPDADGNTLIPISWDFADGSPVDTQSAYKIDFYHNGSMISSTGKIVSSSQSALVPLALAMKGLYIVYTVDVWDNYDTTISAFDVGATGSFITYDPPTVSQLDILQTPTVFASFGGDDSATSLGNPEVGPTPIISAGSTWGLQYGKAYFVSPLNTNTWEFVLYDTGAADGIVEGTFSVLQAAGYNGFVIRSDDTAADVSIQDGYFITDTNFYKAVAGVYTSLGVLSQTFVSGDRWRIHMQGNVMTVYRQVGTADTWTQVGQFTDATHSTKTKHGWHQFAGATATGRLEDFLFTPLTTSTVGTSAAPAFIYNTDSPGPYDIVEIGLIIKKQGVVVYSGVITNPNEDDIFYTNQQVLINSSLYQAILTAKDSKGMTGSRILNFSTLWTPPAAPTLVTAVTTSYNTENAGSVVVGWSDAARDIANFLQWNIYRRVDELNIDGSVAETGVEEFIGSDTTIKSSYTFNDYTAPSGAKATYHVKQVVNRFEAIVESGKSNEVSVTPSSEGYWLIDPEPEVASKASFKLYSVVQDGYSHKFEESEMLIIGRGRRVDRGQDIGIDGSLSCQLRDTGITARQKKRRIEYLKKEVRNLYLRTPFGDVYKVNVGDISVSRIAGVGTSEFVDVTIPYQEVYDA